MISVRLSLETTFSFRRWLIKRTLEDFQSLDRQLHTCVYDRRYSQLPVIHQRENMVHGDKVSHNMGHGSLLETHNMGAHYTANIIMVINECHYVGNNVRFR